MLPMLMRKAISVTMLVAALATGGFAQTSTVDPMRSLPAGDLIVSMNADAIVTRSAPAWLVGNPDKMKELDDFLAEAGARLGVDLRSVRSLVLSVKDPAALSASDVTILMTGTFDTKALRQTWQALGVARSETHEGVAITVLAAPAPGARKVLPEIAAALLDGSTLVAGTPAGVRSAVDARAGRARAASADADLMGVFNLTDPGAEIRLAMRVSPEVTRAQLARTPDDPSLRALSKVRYLFGSVNGSQGLALRLTARAENASDAKTLLDSVTAFLAFGRMTIGQNAKTSRYAALLEGAAVTTAGADVTLTVTAPQQVVQDAFRKQAPPAAGV